MRGNKFGAKGSVQGEFKKGSTGCVSATMRKGSLE